MLHQEGGDGRAQFEGGPHQAYGDSGAAELRRPAGRRQEADDELPAGVSALLWYSKAQFRTIF